MNYDAPLKFGALGYWPSLPMPGNSPAHIAFCFVFNDYTCYPQVLKIVLNDPWPLSYSSVSSFDSQNRTFASNTVSVHLTME